MALQRPDQLLRRVDEEAQGAAEQIVERRRGGAIRHRRDLDMRRLRQLQRGDVVLRADARAAVGELAWIVARIGDQIGERICRKVLVDDQDLRRTRDHRDRGEVAHRVPLQRFEQRRVGGLKAGDRQQQRVAVGRRRATSSVAILPLAPRWFSTTNGWPSAFCKLGRDLPRRDVDAAAGQRWRDDGDGAGRIGLRHGRPAQREEAWLGSFVLLYCIHSYDESDLYYGYYQTYDDRGPDKGIHFAPERPQGLPE